MLARTVMHQSPVGHPTNGTSTGCKTHLMGTNEENSCWVAGNNTMTPERPEHFFDGAAPITDVDIELPEPHKETY